MAYKYNQFQKTWLDDLKTTNAKQCLGELTDQKGGYCCLGRAYVANGYRARSGQYEGERQRLGVEMLSKLKLNSVEGNMSISSFEETSLVELNDNEGMTFKQIAEFIESNPEKVFKDGYRY